MRADVPIPKKMRALAKDKRGFPIPFIVLRDKDGQPIFQVNDTLVQRRALKERRCPICGSRLDRIMWFVGGPLSAFHPHGAYLDSAMHHECMRYALQVCPHLAASNYLSRIDNLDYSSAGARLFVDPTVLPDRPEVFVAVAAAKQTLEDAGPFIHIRPERPYLVIEYWRHGRQLTEREAVVFLEAVKSELVGGGR